MLVNMISCMTCRLKHNYKMAGLRLELIERENECKKLHKQIRRYQDLLKIDEDLEYNETDIDSELNDMFPDKESEDD